MLRASSPQDTIQEALREAGLVLRYLKTKSSITKDELKAMLKDYYNLRGWDQNGLPKVN